MDRRWLLSQAVNSRVIIVVGMHRSGTGLVSRILQDLGVFMGRRLTANQESIFFQNINKDGLDVIGCNWRCIDFLPDPNDLAQGFPWMVDLFRTRLRRGLLQDHFGWSSLHFITGTMKCWGWKDPRNSLLLPVWHQIFPRALVVHVYRDGRDVAMSLVTRDMKRWRSASGFDDREMKKRFCSYFHLWENYLERIEIGVKAFQNTCSIRFESLLENPVPAVRHLAESVGIGARSAIDPIGSSVDRTRTGRFRQHPERSWMEDITASSRMLKELGY